MDDVPFLDFNLGQSSAAIFLSCEIGVRSPAAMGNVFKNLIKKRENRNTRSKAKHYPIRTLDFHQISSNKNGPIEI